MELDDDNGIAAIAAREGCNKKKQKGKSVCHASNVAESIQDAQTGHPTRPQGESNAEEVHTALRVCRSPLEKILANGKPPAAFPIFERLHLKVEVFDRLRTQLGACFSILV